MNEYLTDEQLDGIALVLDNTDHPLLSPIAHELLVTLEHERAAHQTTRAELAQLRDACNHLRAGRLSTSTGGDMSMVFDSSDRDVEMRRRGHVKFDLDHVDEFERRVKEVSK